MSANIYWQPAKKAASLDVSAPSSFIEALSLRGSMGRVFDTKDIPFLEGVKAGRGGNASGIDELIELIFKHGAVRVWAEY